MGDGAQEEPVAPVPPAAMGEKLPHYYQYTDDEIAEYSNIVDTPASRG